MLRIHLPPQAWLFGRRALPEGGGPRHKPGRRTPRTTLASARDRLHPRHDAARSPMSDADRDCWDARYRAGGGSETPSPFLVELEPLLPRAAPGRPAPTALDVAGGAGR